jgi:heptosyltransferase-2
MATQTAPDPTSPILVVPYMWIGDFVRCHSVVKVLKARWPDRPVDLLSTSLCAPLTDYMPGVRKAVVVDLPRKRLALAQQQELAARLRDEGYGSSLVMPRTWKSALAPYLAGIPERTGFAGEVRFGLLNDVRWGEKKLPRMVDRCGMLALPPGAAQPADWPLPEIQVTSDEIAAWKARHGLADDRRPIVALCPGAVGPSKRWTTSGFGALARQLSVDGIAVWMLGGPGEAPLAAEIAALAPDARDLTGTDLRNAIVALAAADTAVSNDSGLLHVAAATGTPSIGIFGPTSAWHWAPLNPLAAAVATVSPLPCQPCHKPVCRIGSHWCMREIFAPQVLEATRRALALHPAGTAATTGP